MIATAAMPASIREPIANHEAYQKGIPPLRVTLQSRWYYTPDGKEVDSFILNRPACRSARILVTGENFGCGSSRDHAPWALADFGIRCIIAPSFADIFFGNCFKNGILPITLPKEQVERLLDHASRNLGAEITVDLERQEITGDGIGSGGGTMAFAVDPFRKHCLINGLDDIGWTLQHASAIDAFEATARQTHVTLRESSVPMDDGL